MPKDRESTKLFFEKNLNEQFTVSLDNEVQLPLELIEVKDGRTSEEFKITSFSLLFKTAKLEQPIPQQLYTLNKDDYEEVLFLNPRQPSDTHSFFEIIFN